MMIKNFFSYETTISMKSFKLSTHLIVFLLIREDRSSLTFSLFILFIQSSFRFFVNECFINKLRLRFRIGSKIGSFHLTKANKKEKPMTDIRLR